MFITPPFFHSDPTILSTRISPSLTSSSSHGMSEGFNFKIEDHKFYLNGKQVLIRAGEMHPARIPHAYWRKRIQMAKAMGLNAIAIYLFWNDFEPEEGQFDFKGRNNISEFLQICKEENMMVLLRPGPYCCAEWEFGGLPYWLLNQEGMKLRENNPAFLGKSLLYFKRLAKEIGKYQCTNGGPIVTVQVENEYGSYGNDKTYMEAIKNQLIEAGFNTPLVVAEGPDQLASAWIPGTVAGANGADSPDIKSTIDKYTPGGPYIVTEYYPGWLDHWGESFVRTDGGVAQYEKLLQAGISVSLYMFHGGTNFGFMNGSNYSNHLEPSITSYDYDAPLDESGRPTAKYYEFRKAIAEATGEKIPPVPKMPALITIPVIHFDKFGSLLGSLPKETATYINPPTFEEIGQAYGYVLYRMYEPSGLAGTLHLKGLRDFATVMVDGKPAGTIDYRLHQDSVPVQFPENGALLDILVGNEGRINYGGHLPDNYHGILGGVNLDVPNLGMVPITNFHVFRIPMKDDSQILFDGKNISGPTFYQADFELSRTGDTFLDMSNWHKGVVWVNDHALGRYWDIGPQQTLYLPGCWLKTGMNRITVFDEKGVSVPTVTGINKPILDTLKPSIGK